MSFIPYYKPQFAKDVKTYAVFFTARPHKVVYDEKKTLE